MRIGIDLGGTKTEAVLVDNQGHVVTRKRVPTPAEEGYDAILGAIVELVLGLDRIAGGTCSVGVGTPGALSHRTNTIKNSNTTCLNGRTLNIDLMKRLGRPVRLENDANCLAISEALNGAAQGAACVFAVILGTGVGGGLVINGHLWAGAHHIAGEWGHNPLESTGRSCYCGRQGCVETWLSGPGFAADYSANGGIMDVTAPEIIARATHQEPAATAALGRYCTRLGRALATVVNILDPDIIVLGGGMSAIPDLYTHGKKALIEHAFTDGLTTPLVPAQHGDSSGVLGAAYLWPAPSIV